MAYERNPLPKKKSVLADHKRIGKRLIPPFLQATNLTEISWLDLLLPELLWIGLFNEKYGYVVGAEVALALPRAAMEVTQKNPRNTWFVTVSSYSKLTPIQQDKIVEILGKNGVIDNYRTALHPLTHFYLDCPLNFLSENDPNQTTLMEN